LQPRILGALPFFLFSLLIRVSATLIRLVALVLLFTTWATTLLFVLLLPRAVLTFVAAVALILIVCH
jgi:hypothetical protein